MGRAGAGPSRSPMRVPGALLPTQCQAAGQRGGRGPQAQRPPSNTGFQLQARGRQIRTPRERDPDRVWGECVGCVCGV